MPMSNTLDALRAHESDKRSSLTIPPLFLLSVAFSLGIWGSRYLSISFFAAALITIGILVILTFYLQKRFFLLLNFVAFFALGVLFGLNDRSVSDRHIALMAPDGFISLEGIVKTVPEVKKRGKKETVSFVLKAENYYRKGTVYDTEGNVQVFLHNPKRTITYGDRLRFRGKLEQPKAARNPHVFDYRNYLAQNDLFNIFRGIGEGSILRQKVGQAPKILILLNRFRVHLRERIKALLPDPHSALANALLLGFRKDIPIAVRDDFIRSGTAHLLAISGLHVSLVAGLFFFLGRQCRLPRSLNLVLVLVVIFLYTILAGARLPVLRSGIMGGVILLGLLWGQERNLKSAFFFAFLMLLAWNPSILFQASFQLSFVAVASLLFLLPKVQKQSRRHPEGARRTTEGSRGSFASLRMTALWVRETVTHLSLASVAVMIGLFPILVWYFNIFSAVGFVANLIAVPLAVCGMVATFFILLLDSVWLTVGQALSFIPTLFFSVELWVLEGLAWIPLGHFYIPKPPWYFFLLYYGFLVAWLATFHRPVANRIRSVFLCGLLITVFFFLSFSRVQTSRFVFFDLGRTDAAFVSFANRANCLIGAGRHFPSDQAYWILRPFFLGSGIHKLDSLILPKVDAVHAGGFETLRQQVRIKHLWFPNGAKHDPRTQKYLPVKQLKWLKVHHVSEGDQLQFGANQQVRAEILAQDKDTILALRFQDGKNGMIYVASARAKTYEALSSLPDLDADLVFLPNQEFDLTKPQLNFLVKVGPQYVVSNQREGLSDFRSQLGAVIDAQVLFLKETGAIELRPDADSWSHRTFGERIRSSAAPLNLRLV